MSLEARELGTTGAALRKVAGALQEAANANRGMVAVLPAARYATGSGVVGATVQRVALATDVALPAGTNNIGDVDVLSCALPTGAATAAHQLTIIARLDSMLLVLEAIRDRLPAALDAGGGMKVHET
jgi:hypothetical protein